MISPCGCQLSPIICSKFVFNHFCILKPAVENVDIKWKMSLWSSGLGTWNVLRHLLKKVREYPLPQNALKRTLTASEKSLSLVHILLNQII